MKEAKSVLFFILPNIMYDGPWELSIYKHGDIAWNHIKTTSQQRKKKHFSKS